MTTTSISQLKVNPSAVIAEAASYPVALAKRNQIAGYFVGKDLFESMIRMLEDQIDAEAVRMADTTKGEPIEEVMKSLGLWRLLSPHGQRNNSKNFLDLIKLL